jgi:hypothetical protein
VMFDEAELSHRWPRKQAETFKTAFEFERDEKSL